jgi:hypothetical protein
MPVPIPDSIALAAGAAKQGLKSLLVGGNAVNLVAYSRTTFDVDLLIPESDVERWISVLASHGYTIFHRTENFVRLRLASDPAAALPIDLMLVDAETFRKMQTGSQSCDLGDDLQLAIPSPLHLIAMKLHALRNPARLESGVDLQDVKHLINRATLWHRESPFPTPLRTRPRAGFVKMRPGRCCPPLTAFRRPPAWTTPRHFGSVNGTPSPCCPQCSREVCSLAAIRKTPTAL